jgi:hypothetical protein
MALDLTEYTIDAENVVENIVEKNERDVKFFFIEHTKALLCIFAKNLAVHRNIILRGPVGE